MHVLRYTSIESFYQDTENFLLQHEAVNCVLIGIISNLRDNPTLYESIYLATAFEDGEVVGAVMRTPPYNLAIACTESEPAISLLMDDVAKVYDSLRGVLGTKENSRFAAESWQKRTGETPRRGMLERVYQLERVVPPNVPGQLRKAVLSDRDRLLQWSHGFHVDAFGEGHIETALIERNVDNALHRETRSFYFWEVEGEPVAMAGYTGFTPNGVRIGPVYTPREHRRKGYGSAVTAAVSQLLLDSGRKYCFLFTDLLNPTSNHIYQTIGYQPVADMDEWLFGGNV